MQKKRSLKNIFLLGGSSLFNDIGSEMITPLLPFYITQLGGGGVAVGLISGLREGLASFLKFFSGWLSDRTGKKKIFVFFGYLISIIFRLLLSIANLWQNLILFVSLERIGKLRDAPRDVIITESSANKNGKNFGLHQMMDTLGGLIGTIAVIFLFWKLNLGIKTIILVAAGVSIFSLVPIIFVREKKSKPLRKNLLSGVKKLSSKLKYFIFVTSIFTLANFGLYMFLLLRAKQITGNTVTPLILYAIFNFIYAFSVTPFGNLSDKIGRKKVLLVGYILLAIVSIGFIFSNNLISIIICFIFYGLVYSLTQSNQKAFVADLAGKMKGTAMGFYSFAVGIMSIIGGIVAGIFWNINPILMFSYTAVISFISVIFLLKVRETKK